MSEPGSLFSLTNGALVDFGTGNNAVNVSNSLCASGGCFAPFANPAFQVAGSSDGLFCSKLALIHSRMQGTFPDGSVNHSQRRTPGSAILAVQPGGTIQIQ